MESVYIAYADIDKKCIFLSCLDKRTRTAFYLNTGKYTSRGTRHNVMNTRVLRRRKRQFLGNTHFDIFVERHKLVQVKSILEETPREVPRFHHFWDTETVLLKQFSMCTHCQCTTKEKEWTSIHR